MPQQSAFWDKIAAKYRARPISDMPAYETTLERTAHHLGPDMVVVELGCGTGGTALRLAPHVAQVLATDFSAGMIAQAEARARPEAVRFAVGDVFAAEVSDAKPGAIIAFNLLHLVDDVPTVLRQIHVLLPEGGLFISKTPCLSDPKVGWKISALLWLLPVMQWLGKAPPVHRFSTQALEAAVEQAGFEIVERGDYPERPPSRFLVARKI